jgi:hypothetical protein
MHRGPVSAQARKDFKHHSIEIAITSECNLNLLEQAKYFLKLIAIFVDFARHFGGGGGGNSTSRELAAGFCSLQNLYF